jgi:protease-4
MRTVMGLLSLMGMLLLLVQPAQAAYPWSQLPKVQKDKIALVRLYGPIFDVSAPVQWMGKLEKGSPKVKAVILDIDSPGGGVAASQELYDAVLRLRKKGIKVVACMGSEAASGGYYVACAADRIVAQPGTLTGSLGVIMEMANAEKLLKWAGVRFEVIKSGAFKDTGNFARAMTPQERRILQDVVDDVYDQFVGAILQGRRAALAEAWDKWYGKKGAKPSPSQLKQYVQTLADGRIYSGRQARDLGLVDKLGSFNDSLDLACDLAGIKGEPSLVAPRNHVPFLQRLTGVNWVPLASWWRNATPRGSMRLCYLAR